MRGLVHVAAGVGLAAVAFALGRWLRDPEPGGALLVLGVAALGCALALRRLYRPGGIGRAPARAAPAPLDQRVDLNTATVAELQRVPGIGPMGARRIVAERERSGPYRTPADLARVAGFGPSRVRALGGRVRVG